MDMTSVEAEHNNIARMCLNLSHNFIRVPKDVKTNDKNGDEKKIEDHDNQECEKNENVEKINKGQVYTINNLQQNIGEESPVEFDDNTQQVDYELLQEQNQKLRFGPNKKKQQYPEEDERKQNFEKMVDEQINYIHNIEKDIAVYFDDDTMKADRALFQELNQQFKDDCNIERPKKPEGDKADAKLFLEFQITPEFQDNIGKEQQIPEKDIKLDLKIVFESEEERVHQDEIDGNIQVQFDKERIDVGNETKVQFCSESHIQENKLKPQNKKHKQMKEQHCSNVDDIERFLIDKSDYKTNNEKQQNNNEETKVISTTSNQEKIENILKEMKELYLDPEKLKTDNIDSIVFKEGGSEQFFNNIYNSFEKDFGHFYERIFQISQSYFPPECKLDRKFNNENNSLFVKDAQQICTNNKVPTRYDSEVHKYANVNVPLLTNDDTQVVSQQVIDDKIKLTVNENKSEVFEKDDKLELQYDIKENNVKKLVYMNTKENEILGQTEDDIEIQHANLNSNELLNHDFENEEQIKLNKSGCTKEFSLEDSDVDVETFSDIVDDFEKQTETEVCIEMFENESTHSSNSSLDKEDYYSCFSGCVEVNEVIEVVEEYDVIKKCDVVNGYISRTGIQTLTDEKSSLDKQKKHKKTDGDINIQHECGEALKQTLETHNPNKLKDLTPNEETKNKQKLVEREREQTTEKSHLQCNSIKYETKQDLTNNMPLSQVLNQNQILDEIKNEFHNIKCELKGVEQQQQINEKRSIELVDFPKKFNELKLIDQNLQKELENFEKDYCKLESEFQHDVQFEESNLNYITEEKPFNIFEKLFAIHNKKLDQFAESKKWPENCLYPSSLLDSLFEDPNEVKPNVLVITLYSIDVGYSIKIAIQKNKLPEEIFYSYDKDTILKYVEQEKLPPELLDLLERANLFYSGCVIAEIYDLIDSASERIYRILLRPHYESIIHDVNKIIKDSSQMDWSYAKKLKLESMVIEKSNPLICGDCLPIAGTAVNMQHQFLSCRTISLNPLTNDFITSKSKPLKTDIFNKIDTIEFTSKFSDKFLCKSFDSTDCTSVKHSILWKFNFQLPSSKIKILKLYILVHTDTLKHSLVLTSNLSIKPISIMKVEIQFGPEMLEGLIILFLDILRQKIRPDIEAIRIYKCEKFSYPNLGSFPTKWDNTVYERNRAIITQLIDTLLASVCKKYSSIENYLKNLFEGLSYKKKFKLPIHSKSLSDTQNTGEKLNENRDKNLQMEHKFQKSIQVCSTKKLSKNSTKYLDLTNMKLKDQTIINSPSKKDQEKIKLSDLFNITTIEDSSQNTETNDNTDLSFTEPLFLNDSSIHLVQENLDSISEILPIPVTIQSSLSDSISEALPIYPYISGPINVMSSLPCYLTLVSSQTSNMSTFEEPISDSDVPNNNISTFEAAIINSPYKNVQFQTNGQSLTEINDDSGNTDNVYSQMNEET